MARISVEFDDMIKKTANARIKNGVSKLGDRDSISTRRITLGLSRHLDMPRIMDDIAKAEWEGDKPSKKRWRL